MPRTPDISAEVPPGLTQDDRLFLHAGHDVAQALFEGVVQQESGGQFGGVAVVNYSQGGELCGGKAFG
jgi:hypothetical protein